MVMRYFNIKEGSKSANGSVVAVDTSARPQDRLKSFDNLYALSLIYDNGNFQKYRVSGKSYIVGSERVAAPGLAARSIPGVPIGDDAVKPFVLEVNREGSLEARVNRPGSKVFVSEINEKEALKQKDEAERWLMTQELVAG